jgi:hypothetical protein
MKARLVFSLLFLLGARLGFAQPKTPPTMAEGRIFIWPAGAGGNGHYYQAMSVPAGITWEDAQNFALTKGGHLVTITSNAENDVVFRLVDDPQYWGISGDGNYATGPWLGGQQRPGALEPGGGWEWVNNEGPLSYTHWLPGQPDNSNSANEDRLAYLSRGVGNRSPTWNDQPGSAHIKSFVIEYESNRGFVNVGTIDLAPVAPNPAGSPAPAAAAASGPAISTTGVAPIATASSIVPWTIVVPGLLVIWIIGGVAIFLFRPRERAHR